jgi:TPR repeat protein
MVNLGMLLRRRGDKVAAKDLCRKGAEAGDPAGMWALGVLLAKKGKKDEANDWYRRGTLALKTVGQ